MTSLANRRSAILLFSLPDCLHSHRTRLVIKEKEISAELHEIDINNISEEIKSISPYDDFPTLVDRDLILQNSDIDHSDLDMIFGQESYPAGEFRYCENTGTAISAQFATPTINNYGLNGSMFYSPPTLELADLDGDDMGDPSMMVEACSPPEGYVSNAFTTFGPAPELDVQYACIATSPEPQRALRPLISLAGIGTRLNG